MTQREKDDAVMKNIASTATLAYQNTQLLADAMIKEKERTDAITSATFDTLSKRQRPVFVHGLRSQGYSQAEVGGMVGRSQSAISKYEQSFNKHNEK